MTLFEPGTGGAVEARGRRRLPVLAATSASSTARIPTLGASLDYMLTKPAKAVSLKITDVNGKVVRDFRAAADRGRLPPPARGT